MKKLMMVLGVFLVGAIASSFDAVGYYPGVRLYYDHDHDGFYVRTSLPQSIWKYNAMLGDDYITIDMVKGKEPNSMDNNKHLPLP